jgi:dephospho-CoA kinase
VKTFGITGGIGMGKSTAAGILRGRGIPVIDTDDIAREIVEPGQPALAEIKDAFGDGILDADGSLNRRKLAALVFSDAPARARLESILHPRIAREWETRLSEWRKQGRAVAAVVIPLLFETGADKSFDSVICLACSESTQKARLAARGWSPDEISQRINAQMSVAEKVSRASHVVWTEGEVGMIARQLDRIFVR